MTNRTLPGFSVVKKTRLTRSPMTAALVAVLLATGIGCGDQASPTAPDQLTPAPSSPPGPVPATTVPAANNGEVGVYQSDVTMSRSGTATVTLEWPNADFSLQLYVTRGGCVDTRRLVTGACTILGSTRAGALPGVVTGFVTGGDRYVIWVLNPDPAPQPFNVDVYIE